VTAGDIVRQMEYVREPILDRCRGEDEAVGCIHLADAGAHDGVIALDLRAFIDDDDGEHVHDIVREGWRVDAFDVATCHRALAGLTDAALLFGVDCVPRFVELVIFCHPGIHREEKTGRDGGAGGAGRPSGAGPEAVGRFWKQL